MEYQQIAAVVLSCPSLVRTLPWWWFWNGGRGDVVVFVFGTLLGPEATGPGDGSFFCGGCVPGLFVSGFPGHDGPRAFGCVGCVVWGCCLRTT